MTEVLPKPNHQLVELTAEIVAAYVSNNPVPVGELPAFIAQVHASIAKLNSPESQVEEQQTPRMPIKKTITPDYLISLEDGKRYKTLKRHLSVFGLTPDEYRAKWGLPGDYPMTAPNYSVQRSQLAKSLGLGRKPAAKQLATRSPRKAKA
ncbi:MucR family transcriptional regulator [Mesorhizobium sp. ANAO-SY3R2]|uniref:MucR family transcriptional regulator n=1 Tax=Mesorhizobium sp. ANAO-SY3R2 TaxID=3166644 RepID=UPI00366B807E